MCNADKSKDKKLQEECGVGCLFGVIGCVIGAAVFGFWGAIISFIVTGVFSGVLFNKFRKN